MTRETKRCSRKRGGKPSSIASLSNRGARKQQDVAAVHGWPKHSANNREVQRVHREWDVLRHPRGALFSCTGGGEGVLERRHPEGIYARKVSFKMTSDAHEDDKQSSDAHEDATKDMTLWLSGLE